MTHRAAFALFLTLLFIIQVSAQNTEQNVTDVVKSYLVAGEEAELQTITSNGSTVYAVLIDKNVSMFLDGNYSIISGDELLRQTLIDYYTAIRPNTFTPKSATEVESLVNTAYDQFSQCNQTFYKYVQTNFFWFQYKCIDVKIATTCRTAFALRGEISDLFASLKQQSDGLATIVLTQPKSTVVSKLETIESTSSTLKTKIADFDAYYKFFFGKTMANHDLCRYDSSLLASVLTKTTAAIRASVFDLSTEIALIKERTAFRSALRDVNAEKTEGLRKYAEYKAIKEAVKKNYTDAGFSASGIEKNFNLVQSDFDKLQKAVNSSDVSLLTEKIKKDGEVFKGNAEGFNSILELLNQTRSSFDLASKAIDFVVRKYGEKDERVIALKSEYQQAKQNFTIMENDLKAGKLLNKTEVEAVQLKAKEVAERAKNLPLKESELDTTTLAIIALVIFLIVGAVVYYLKFRKPPQGPTTYPTLAGPDYANQ